MRNEAYLCREFCRRALLFSVLCCSAAMALGAPAVLLETARLAPAGDPPHFGNSVAIDGNIAVVGATEITSGVLDFPGAAYVFERNSAGVWQQTARLTRSSDQQGDMFGADVAIDGNVIVVGDLFHERAYVFEKQGTSWVRTAELGTAGPGSGNGYSVAVH
ncbi:FG-GAP repeat protein, partial [Steroidobacter sp.]|uniref:FG-GAP repeat protein n=1 Tax=Steroidobacter sp. TaxID=1978227 RepID=UPI001A3FA326